MQNHFSLYMYCICIVYNTIIRICQFLMMNEIVIVHCFQYDISIQTCSHSGFCYCHTTKGYYWQRYQQFFCCFFFLFIYSSLFYFFYYVLLLDSLSFPIFYSFICFRHCTNHLYSYDISFETSVTVLN